jgi:hypothetical protein
VSFPISRGIARHILDRDWSNSNFVTVEDVHVQEMVVVEAFNGGGVGADMELSTTTYQKWGIDFGLEDYNAQW